MLKPRRPVIAGLALAGALVAVGDTAEGPRVDAVRRALDAVQVDALTDVVVSS